MKTPPPNVLFVFADQWRAQAVGHAGDPNVRTPHLDALASQSIHMVNAVSSSPVCTPARASLMTGQYPHTHGLFLNDLCLGRRAVSMAEAFNRAGYDTAWIGKWHLDGHGRGSFTPMRRRQGFRYWRALECTHDYNRSCYYRDTEERLIWQGYDALAQTREACAYLTDPRRQGPFALFLSWGPPHPPYGTAPEPYRAMYDPAAITLRPNVPADIALGTREHLAGYYAHCSALDACMGMLVHVLRERGLAEDTILIFSADHGDMLGSHGCRNKQWPYDESIRVPFLLRYPRRFGWRGMRLDAVFDFMDIMPTLLGLCGIPIPETVEGLDFSGYLHGGEAPGDGAALLNCLAPFGEFRREKGGREYRGLRTARHTYVQTLEGPWLLYDNMADPYQLDNLCGRRKYAALARSLETLLHKKLEGVGDAFLPAAAYLGRWGYAVDGTGAVPYER